MLEIADLGVMREAAATESSIRISALSTPKAGVKKVEGGRTLEELLNDDMEDKRLRKLREKPEKTKEAHGWSDLRAFAERDGLAQRRKILPRACCPPRTESLIPFPPKMISCVLCRNVRSARGGEPRRPRQHARSMNRRGLRP